MIARNLSGTKRASDSSQRIICVVIASSLWPNISLDRSVKHFQQASEVRYGRH